ncbi:MAG: thymidine phosphorylase [Pseudomonadota bacterium]
MLFTDVIRSKRDGGSLSPQQIQLLVNGLADQSIPAEQVSALAMAVFFNGMSFDEAAMLTRAMARSGTVLDWSTEGLDGPVVDKHSTGGVGDKVSFLLAPIAAACGCYVPMISGRGLGHTGGTTDKIESIPGYESAPDFDRFRKVVRDVGASIIGQTADLAPADRRLYAIRDVTATVESVPLITASILSKKIAAGLQGLVMDVKCGSGAFMDTPDKARALASSIINTANAAGLTTHALITDMNDVLGYSAGNALEIAECVRFLNGDAREARLQEVVIALTAEMLLIGGVAADRDAAAERCRAAVDSGRAAEAFARMVAAMGGPTDFVERYADYLVTAPVTRAVHADGVLVAMDTRGVGNAIIELGGGRRQVGQQLDLSVGFENVAPLGTSLDTERPLAIIHAASEADANKAAELLLAACEFETAVPETTGMVREILHAELV